MRTVRFEELVYPFAFPIVKREPDNVISVYSDATFSAVDEDAAFAGHVPKMDIFVGTGFVWSPIRIFAIASSGRKLFGHKLAHAEFEYAEPRTFDIAELRTAAAQAVRNDPDDLWIQGAVAHETTVARIEAASTFDEIVVALLAASGG